MSEYQDPPLRLLIQGLRWDGEDWSTRLATDEPIEFRLHGTDSEGDEQTVLRALRSDAVRRFAMHIFGLVGAWDALDFDRPDWPTTADLSRLVEKADTVATLARVLRELAPEIIDDDDDDDEPEQDPEPETPEKANA
jgi:hypothetical protein